MNKTIILALTLSCFVLCSCTRESSKTSENKKSPETTENKTGQTNTNTPSTEKKPAEVNGQSSPESAGNLGNGLPKFTEKNYKKSYKGCDDKKEDCTNFQVYYPEMTEGAYKDKVNALVKDMALSSYSTDDKHYPDFDKLMDGFMKDYEDFRKEFPDAPAVWYLKDSTAIVYNSSYILCLANISENYLGGAHGSYNVAYTNFDMRNGNVLKTKDIFNKGYETALNKMIEAQYRKQMNLKPGEPLIEGGLFDNKIAFNDNFAITNEGIEFLYNQYEIAPYAVGVIDIKLTYKELDAILNKEVIKM